MHCLFVAEVFCRLSSRTRYKTRSASGARNERAVRIEVALVEAPLSARKFNYTYKATTVDRNDHERRQKLRIREANRRE